MSKAHRACRSEFGRSDIHQVTDYIPIMPNLDAGNTTKFEWGLSLQISEIWLYLESNTLVLLVCDL